MEVDSTAVTRRWSPWLATHHAPLALVGLLMLTAVAVVTPGIGLLPALVLGAAMWDVPPANRPIVAVGEAVALAGFAALLSRPHGWAAFALLLVVSGVLVEECARVRSERDRRSSVCAMPCTVVGALALGWTATLGLHRGWAVWPTLAVLGLATGLWIQRRTSVLRRDEARANRAAAATISAVAFVTVAVVGVDLGQAVATGVSALHEFTPAVAASSEQGLTWTTVRAELELLATMCFIALSVLFVLTLPGPAITAVATVVVGGLIALRVSEGSTVATISSAMCALVVVVWVVSLRRRDVPPSRGVFAAAFLVLVAARIWNDSLTPYV